MLMIKEQPPQEATIQKYAREDPTDQRIDPVLQALMNTQKAKTNAKIETPSLSYEPATERDM